jgi:hypothetical protein
MGDGRRHGSRVHRQVVLPKLNFLPRMGPALQDCSLLQLCVAVIL